MPWKVFLGQCRLCFPRAPSCPPRTEIEGSKCVSHMELECDKPAIWDGKGCSINAHVDCEVGIQEGDNCITGTSPACQDGVACQQTFRSVLLEQLLMVLNCVWQDLLLNTWSTKFQTSRCVNGIRSCPPGHKFANARCEGSELPFCPTNLIWKLGRCVRISKEHCELGCTLRTQNVFHPPRLTVAHLGLIEKHASIEVQSAWYWRLVWSSQYLMRAYYTRIEFSPNCRRNAWNFHICQELKLHRTEVDRSPILISSPICF